MVKKDTFIDLRQMYYTGCSVLRGNTVSTVDGYNTVGDIIKTFEAISKVLVVSRHGTENQKYFAPRIRLDSLPSLCLYPGNWLSGYYMRNPT